MVLAPTFFWISDSLEPPWQSQLYPFWGRGCFAWHRTWFWRNHPRCRLESPGWFHGSCRNVVEKWTSSSTTMRHGRGGGLQEKLQVQAGRLGNAMAEGLLRARMFGVEAPNNSNNASLVQSSHTVKLDDSNQLNGGDATSDPSPRIATCLHVASWTIDPHD